MKTLLVVVLVVAAACGPRAPAAAPIPSHAIFRQIDISPFGTITLGDSLLPRAASLEIWRGTRLFALGPAYLRPGGTDSILVRVDAARRVIAITFYYPATKDYAATIADYDSTLGPPARRMVRDSAGGRIERIVWRDRRTRFEVSRFVGADAMPRMWSMMEGRINEEGRTEKGEGREKGERRRDGETGR